jgi:aspartate-semialdehyde dehydrogenase
MHLCFICSPARDGTMHLLLSRRSSGFVTNFQENMPAAAEHEVADATDFKRCDVCFNSQSGSGDVEIRILIKH